MTIISNGQRARYKSDREIILSALKAVARVVLNAVAAMQRNENARRLAARAEYARLAR